MCDLEGMKPVTQPDGRVTIKDIADRLGISKATVSRALLKRARVAPETRNNVIRTAEEMGYRPDPTLRALSNLRWTQHASKRISYQIALLNMNLNLRSTSGSNSRWPTNTGTRERAAELGLELETFDVTDSKGLRRFGDILYHRGFDGVVFGVKCPVEDWRFPYERFPCVAISYDNPSHRLHQVTSDWFSAVSIAMREVLSRGYQRPGFLHYVRGNPAIDQRTWAGMLAGRERITGEFGTAPTIFEYKTEHELGDKFYTSNYERFLEWKEREQPDVIIDSAFLGHWWLRDAGLVCPEEMGSVRLCRHQDDHRDEISAVDHNLAQQGRWAVDILYSMIQTGARGLAEKPVRITVACEFFAGQTLR
jgi:LacI family transcriptional regulator/LacI family repressor for deo operon, udp, cdd, tsx, nupC, and nupG